MTRAQDTHLRCPPPLVTGGWPRKRNIPSLYRPASGEATCIQVVEDKRLVALEWLVRAGFWARGLTYAVMGGLALALALGAGTFGEAPNQQGALSLLAQTDLGRAALVVVAVSLL